MKSPPGNARTEDLLLLVSFSETLSAPAAEVRPPNRTVRIPPWPESSGCSDRASTMRPRRITPVTSRDRRGFHHGAQSAAGQMSLPAASVERSCDTGPRITWVGAKLQFYPQPTAPTPLHRPFRLRVEVLSAEAAHVRGREAIDRVVAIQLANRSACTEQWCCWPSA